MERKDIEYLQKFRKSFEIKDLLAYFAFYAWERLEASSKYSNKVNEEEITNTLVHEILSALCSEKAILPIRFFHSKKERVNGNDLEIVIPVDSTHRIIMPCQAKKLYIKSDRNISEAKYEQIDHVVGRGLSKRQQINCLLEHSKDVKGFPIYLFYNYTDHEVDTKGNYPQRQLYGTTIVSANFIYEKFYSQNQGKVVPFKFQDIHPPARPLISVLDPDFIPKLTTYLGTAKHTLIKQYTDEDLLAQEWWDEYCPPIGQIKRRSSSSIQDILSSTPNTYSFNPKYRIQILREPIFYRKTKNR